MSILTIASQKGGTSKTTLAVCLAVSAQTPQAAVALVDTDSQGSLTLWQQIRTAETPPVFSFTTPELRDKLPALREQFAQIIIDTPGKNDPATAAAIQSADVCLIPCRPTVLDLSAVAETVAVCKRLNITALGVLTQVPPRGTRAEQARLGLAALLPMASITVGYRMAYQDALGLGQGITESHPHSPATDEIRALWLWLQAHLRKA